MSLTPQHPMVMLVKRHGGEVNFEPSMGVKFKMDGTQLTEVLREAVNEAARQMLEDEGAVRHAAHRLGYRLVPTRY